MEFNVSSLVCRTLWTERIYGKHIILYIISSVQFNSKNYTEDNDDVVEYRIYLFTTVEYVVKQTVSSDPSCCISANI